MSCIAFMQILIMLFKRVGHTLIADVSNVMLIRDAIAIFVLN